MTVISGLGQFFRRWYGLGQFFRRWYVVGHISSLAVLREHHISFLDTPPLRT
jgi:hypothetical protein